MRFCGGSSRFKNGILELVYQAVSENEIFQRVRATVLKMRFLNECPCINMHMPNRI